MTQQPSRREILISGLAAGAGLAAAASFVSPLQAALRGAKLPAASSQPAIPPGASSKLRVLILGGTGFLGPALMDAALARGHHVTLFNRGKTEKKKPGQFNNPAVEKLYGNRDPNLNADESDPSTPKGLAALEGKTWDAAIDTSAYFPRIAKASTELLAKSVKHYTFISTISVYPDNDKPNADESAPVGTINDPTTESMGAHSENYGPLKALCEAAAEAAMPGRVLNVRPGFIVGPGDPTDRFTYWPVVAARSAVGGEFACPGDGSDPVQYIDVRDLAEWIIRCIEKGVTGVFNATGPAKQMTFGALIEACTQVAKARAGEKANLAKPAWLPLEFLGEQTPGIYNFPIWLPSEGETAGFHSRSIAKALAQGLTFRSARDTVDATLTWWPKELERRVTVTAQLKADAEAAGKPAPKMADPELLRAGLPFVSEQDLLMKFRTWEKTAKSKVPSSPAQTPAIPGKSD